MSAATRDGGRGDAGGERRPGVRDHGGGIDAARARWGGERADWLDLSTGINPVPYPLPDLPADAWTALPDRDAFEGFRAAARRFWEVPDGAEIVAAPGASALIAALPRLLDPAAGVEIPGPTYNEHAAAFAAQGWGPGSGVRVLVHPNNPDGAMRSLAEADAAPVTILDESFCDTAPDRSHVSLADRPGRIVLKSFGKFWGLAGLRLGVAIGHPDTLAPEGGPGLADLLGPWAVSGPALAIGTAALSDPGWAEAARARLTQDAARLDTLVDRAGGRLAGGTRLFRLYEVDDARRWQARLAEGRVWSRVFPYSDRWLRLGLPDPDRFGQLDAALGR